MKASGLLAAVVALISAGSAASRPQATAATTVRITMTPALCRALPSSVEPGATTFVVRNRTQRSRLFTIAGRRTAYIPPRRTGLLGAQLSRAGVYRYFCISRGPRRAVRTGVVAVRSRAVPPPPAPEHRIAVRTLGSRNELYDRQTGRTFVPRGNNYVRIGLQEDYDGRVFSYHSTFNVGLYDGARADAALARMHADGYNTVRVFLNGLCRNACLGDPSQGLRGSYLANVGDFLRRAKANDLFVILTIDWLPSHTSYDQRLAPSDWVDGSNVNYLTDSGLRANADFFGDLVHNLVLQRAPTDDVLGYELRNELSLDSLSKPFTLSSGLAPMPNGVLYNLSSQAQKNKLLDDNLVYWIGLVRSAIRAVDPTALVTVGFFEPQEPNPSRRGDTRIIRTRAAIRDSAADFVDIHAYPGLDLTLRQYMQNFGIDGTEAKPLVIGEMGAFKSAFPAAGDGALALSAWQRDSCAYGIDGWLTWTWDTDEQPELWNALGGGGAIERALAPGLRPDPCAH
jgi:Cellulase (glycosyl hydrolase family 5)